MKKFISPGSWFAFNYPEEWFEFSEEADENIDEVVGEDADEDRTDEDSVGEPSEESSDEEAIEEEAAEEELENEIVEPNDEIENESQL
jgi:hypothetical protein